MVGNAVKVVAKNKKARFEYEVVDRYEAGMVLEGSEVKSLRDGGVSIDEAYVIERNGELFILNMKIPTYRNAGFHVPETTRQRKLLLHQRQIRRVANELQKTGLTCVPLAVYFKDGWAKAEIALVKHRTKFDKRQKLKERDTQREMQRFYRRH